MTETIQEQKIKKIKIKTLDFFKIVKKQNLLIMESLKHRENKKLQKIIENEKIINKKYSHLFKKNFYKLALVNAYGKDLRSIVSSLYIIYELERIADYVNLTAIFLIKKTKLKEENFLILIEFWDNLLPIFEEVEKLLEIGILEKITDFLNKRKKIENIKNEDLINHIPKIEFIQKKGLINYLEFFYQFRTIERINDHLTNIVEWILFEKSFIKFKDYQKNN